MMRGGDTVNVQNADCIASSKEIAAVRSAGQLEGNSRFAILKTRNPGFFFGASPGAAWTLEKAPVMRACFSVRFAPWAVVFQFSAESGISEDLEISFFNLNLTATPCAGRRPTFRPCLRR